MIGTLASQEFWILFSSKWYVFACQAWKQLIPVTVIARSSWEALRGKIPVTVFLLREAQRCDWNDKSNTPEHCTSNPLLDSNNIIAWRNMILKRLVTRDRKKKKKPMTARDVTGFYIFSPPRNRATSSAFWGSFLITQWTWRKGKNPLENIQKTSSGDGGLEIADCCRLSWSNVSWAVVILQHKVLYWNPDESPCRTWKLQSVQCLLQALVLGNQSWRPQIVIACVQITAEPLHRNFCHLNISLRIEGIFCGLSLQELRKQSRNEQARREMGWELAVHLWFYGPESGTDLRERRRRFCSGNWCGVSRGFFSPFFPVGCQYFYAKMNHL